MPDAVPHSVNLLPAGDLGGSKALACDGVSARTGQIQIDWGTAHSSKAAPHPKAAHISGQPQTELSPERDKSQAAEALDLQHQHIRAVFQPPGSSSPAATAVVEAGQAVDVRADAEAAPVLTPYRAPTEHRAILFQCPLTKVGNQLVDAQAEGCSPCYLTTWCITCLESPDLDVNTRVCAETPLTEPCTHGVCACLPLNLLQVSLLLVGCGFGRIQQCAPQRVIEKG